jgi:hypothetical protein
MNTRTLATTIALTSILAECVATSGFAYGVPKSASSVQSVISEAAYRILAPHRFKLAPGGVQSAEEPRF